MTVAQAIPDKNLNALEAQVFSIMMEMVPTHLKANVELRMDTVLTDLGIGSMAKISLAYKLEQALHIDLSAYGDAIADVQTVGDVLQLLRAGS